MKFISQEGQYLHPRCPKVKNKVDTKNYNNTTNDYIRYKKKKNKVNVCPTELHACNSAHVLQWFVSFSLQKFFPAAFFKRYAADRKVEKPKR